MQAKKSNALLIGFSILGFLAMIAGPILFYYTEAILTLSLPFIGMIVSMICSSQSYKEPPKKYLPDFEKLRIQSAPKPVIEPLKPSPTAFQTDTIVKDPTKDDLEKFSVHLLVDNEAAEALLRLVEKMEEHQLVQPNAEFEANNHSKNPIFKDQFLPVPLIGLVATREGNFNILAGIQPSDAEIIGTFYTKNLQRVKEIHPKTQSIQALIYGGRFKSPENTLHNQTYRVFLTFYT